MRYEGFGSWAEFVIDSGGQSVQVELSENADPSEALSLLDGQLSSCVRSQQGYTCLHAAVVTVGDRVIAVSGPSGAGKSTTALALVRSGARLVTDDVAALSVRACVPVVAVGTPVLRLASATAESLGSSFDSLGRTPFDRYEPGKRMLELGDELAVVASDPLPLDGVYLLAPRLSGGRVARIRAVDRTLATARLMANRHMAHLLGSRHHHRDMGLLAAVAQQVPVRELEWPEGLDHPDRVAAAVMADVESLGRD